MKLKFKLLTLLLAISCATVFAGQNEFTKEHHFAYTKDAVESLKITNKYGQVTISDQGGDSITIDVTVMVEHASENKAEYLLDQIEIDVRKSGSKLIAETEIGTSFKSKQNFKINYNINIPADRALEIINKYGNVVLDELNASGNFTIDYGNITAGNMQAPDGESISLSLAYSKADFQDVNRLGAEIKYSKLYMGASESVILESRYSTIDASKIGNLKFDSRYDGVSIDELGKLKAESKYTNYSIDRLHSDLILDNGYGSVRVESVSSNFNLIDITNNYGGIRLGLGDANYKIDAECDYCGIVYPSEKYVGNRIKDNHNMKLQGNVGEGGGKIVINSRYGSIKLTD